MTIQNKVSTVTLMAGGIVGPVVKPVDHFAEKILPVFMQTDIRFGQCEYTFSGPGWPSLIYFRSNQAAFS